MLRLVASVRMLAAITALLQVLRGKQAGKSQSLMPSQLPALSSRQERRQKLKKKTTIVRIIWTQTVLLLKARHISLANAMPKISATGAAAYSEEEEAEEAEEAARQAEQVENPPPAQQATGPPPAQQAAGHANDQLPANKSSTSRPQSQNSNDSGIGSDLSNSASKNVHDRLGVRITDTLGSKKVPEDDYDTVMSSHQNEGNDSVFSPVPKTALEINIDNVDRTDHADDTHMSKSEEEGGQAAAGPPTAAPTGVVEGASAAAGASATSDQTKNNEK